MIGRLYYWYSKGSIWHTVGRIFGTILTGLGILDTIFGTHFVGWFLIVNIYFVPYIILKVGPIVLKLLNLGGFVQLTREQEVLRKVIGVTSGISDAVHAMIDLLFR